MAEGKYPVLISFMFGVIAIHFTILSTTKLLFFFSYIFGLLAVASSMWVARKYPTTRWHISAFLGSVALVYFFVIFYFTY